METIINFRDFFKNKSSENITDEIEEQIVEQKTIKPILEQTTIEDNLDEETIDKEVEHIIDEQFYSIYKDKAEDFKCQIELEGANLSDTTARLILETDEWSVVFNGEIDRKGNCVIPLKKMSILNEGVIGKIKLEVVADNSLFVPWSDDFKVKFSKKVTIKMNENKNVPAKKQEQIKTGVKVSIKK